MKFPFSWIFHGSTKETRECLLIFKKKEIFALDFLQKPYADYDYLLKVLYYYIRQISHWLSKLENINVSNSDKITVLQIIRLKLDSRRNILCHHITKITLQHHEKIKDLHRQCNYYFVLFSGLHIVTLWPPLMGLLESSDVSHSYVHAIF